VADTCESENEHSASTKEEGFFTTLATSVSREDLSSIGLITIYKNLTAKEWDLNVENDESWLQRIILILFKQHDIENKRIRLLTPSP
jgi:hypothetical protein